MARPRQALSARPGTPGADRPRRVLIVSPRFDTAGCGINLKRAFDKAGHGWEARHIRRRAKWLNYPSDAEWDQFHALYRWADVLHVMESPLTGYAPKPMIVHHLGSRFRDDPEGVSEACQRAGAIELAASHDLSLLPHLGWLPITTDLDELADLRRRLYRPSPKVRILHAPTNRRLKATAHVIEAVERLGDLVEFDLIERMPWPQFMERKALADVVIDELDLGYGMNAIESWAMGLPVVSGVSEGHLRAAMVEDFGELPFAEANPDTLGDVIESLVLEPELRAKYGQRGREHAHRFHSHEAVVKRAVGIYERALQ